MNQSSSPDSNQRTNISDASVEGQVSQAGRDSTQLQGQGNIYKDVTITNIYNQEVDENCQLTRQKYLNRRALLTKVKNFWVEGVLKKSLHEQVLITLGLEARSDAVTTPWTVVLTEAEEPSIPLPQETQVITLFDELGAGRTLLILGEPGAGKTITLLQLADALITRAERDINHLIPVVFNLSSWSPQFRHGKRQPHLVTIAEWLVEELGSKYQVPRKIGKAWVEQQELLLLLDGLDEVRPEYREDCVRALNAFQEEIGTETVVCCRREDYESLSVRFNFQRAIFLKPLTPEQVCNYVNQLHTNLTGLKTLLDEDVALQELAQSPLTLSMMVLAYHGLNVEDLPKPALAGERRQQLFDIYIERMLQWRGRDRRYSHEKTVRWLSWLAQRMLENSQTVFLIERIQPTWLQAKRELRTFTVTVGICSGLIVGLMFLFLSGLLYGLISGLIFGLITSLLSGLIAGLVYGRNFKIEPAEKLAWSWLKVRNNLIFMLGMGVVCGLISGWVAGARVGVSAGLVLGLLFLLSSGLNISQSVETTAAPNQGIHSSVKNVLTSGLIFEVISGPIWAVYFGSLYSGSLAGPVLGFYFGVFAGADYGSVASIQHFALRLIIYFQGFAPWNYAQFLDHAAERVFLHKVGGGYIFVHRLLMEHFAAMDV